MEVVYTGIRQNPQTIVQTAIQEDVEAIGLSILSGAHIELFTIIAELLSSNNMVGVLLFAGGIIPESDHQELKRFGVKSVFGPRSKTSDIVNEIKSYVLKQRLG